MVKRLVRQLISVIIAVGLLWYVLKGVPLTELTTQFLQANPYWIGITTILILLYHVSRAARWRLALQALGYSPSLFRTTVAMLAGALASMIIPGAGEVTRCGTLQRTDGVPLAQGVGSVVAERVVDLISLLVIITLTVLLEFNRVSAYFIDVLSPLFPQLSTDGSSNKSLIVGALIGLGLLIFLYRLLQSEAFWRHRFVIRVVDIISNVKRGFLSIRQLKQPGLFIALTVVSYVLIFLLNYALFFSTSQTAKLPPTAVLTILAVSSLGGLAVPTQGGLGTYHFLVSRALVLYGMTLTQGVVVATFLHGVQVGFSLLLSSLSFLIIPILITKRSLKPTESLQK
ncbi:lysylphosphatidylglycerol synthase transmembrane domain-containing protein [Spirosoma gilvum]